MDYAANLSMVLPEIVLTLGGLALLLVAAWGGPAGSRAVSWVSVAVLAEPVGASFLAAVVLGELPTTLELIGGAIILTGIGLATWKKG